MKRHNKATSGSDEPRPNIARLVRSSLSTGTADTGSAPALSHSLLVLPELARLLVSADFGAVTVLGSDGKVTDMIYAGLAEHTAAKIGDPPRGIGVLGRLGERDSPLRLDDLSSHPASVGFPPNHPDMRSLLGVRVTGHSGTLANLYVANGPERGGFSGTDEEKIVALASYAALALDNAQLYEDEARLRASAQAAERRLEAVIRGSAAGVVVRSAMDGTFVQVSGEATRISGVDFAASPTEAAGKFEMVHHRPDGTPVPASEAPINLTLSTGTAYGPVEMLFIRPGGEGIPVLVSGAPVFSVEGDLDSVVCVFVDITKLKELDRAKHEFLSTVTHDLRTPLATIKGMASAALDAAQSDAETAAAYLAPIDEEVDYLTELVSNLLDMARIEAGADVFDYEICHMADIAQDSVARMSRSRDGRDRNLHLNVPPDLPSIYADPGQIGRVLDNLVSNAFKYSDHDVSLVARPGPGAGFIRVEVSDRGPGIPEEYKDAIFDRFSRLRGSASRGRQGSGLGLAICKSIVEAHSGRIGVESSDKGSRFWFTVPVDAGDVETFNRHSDARAD